MSLTLSQQPGLAPGCACPPTTATAPSFTPAHAGWRHLTGRIRHLLDRRRWRQDLAALDDRLLADIGVTREQARREAGKSFWA